MTAADQQQLAAVKPVVSSTDYALLGTTLTEAGLNKQAIAAVIQQIKDQTALAAESVALGAAQAVAQAMTNVHHNAAISIYEEINRLNPAGGTFGLHAKCAKVALDAAKNRPIINR